jgi:hypothetical protein
LRTQAWRMPDIASCGLHLIAQSAPPPALRGGAKGKFGNTLPTVASKANDYEFQSENELVRSLKDRLVPVQCLDN